MADVVTVLLLVNVCGLHSTAKGFEAERKGKVRTREREVRKRSETGVEMRQ